MKAKIATHNGAPTVIIDGEAFPPLTMCPSFSSAFGAAGGEEDVGERFAAYRAAGARIFFVSCYTNWVCPERRYTDADGSLRVQPSGIEQFKRDAEKLLRAVPDAYLMLRLVLNPPIDWVAAHPEDILLYQDGKPRPVMLSVSMRGPEELPGMYSLCSEAYRRDAARALEEYFDEFEKLWFKDRIAGFSLCAAGTSEWYYPEGNLITDFKQGIYGDFSPSFRRHYGAFLRNRYADEQALRRAWGDPEASFENPKIPDLLERRYTVINDGILEAMLEYESADRKVGGLIEHDPKGENFLGVFLNANTHRHVADFFNAWHQGTADTIVHLAREVKRRYPDMLVGSYYGALGCCDYYQFGTQEATLSILDSGVVDFLCSAGSYNNREPGLYVAQREMQDSFRLRNQVYFIELDNRTHHVGDFYRDAMALYTMEDTQKTIKRDFARVICEDVQSWFFDFATTFAGDGTDGWMKKEGFYDFLKQLGDAAKFAFTLDREKKSEIALIYDLESLHYASQLTDAMFCDIYRSSDLGRIGAPTDYYFHNDLSREDMPDYKMYIMINLFYLSDAERAAIKAKARKNKATVVWLYAPGFINPDAKPVMSNRNIEDTVGMRVGRTDATVSPWFRLTQEGARALRYADPTRRYGYIDRDVHSTVWLGSVFPPPNFRPMPPAHMNPGFYIDDESAKVLGRFCIDGKAALALREDDGYTSVYCAAQFLRSEILQSLAERAGVHLYVHSDDHICANESFVMIHAGETGARTLYFKEPCSPFECFKKRTYAQNVTELTLEMKRGDTLMFSLKGGF